MTFDSRSFEWRLSYTYFDPEDAQSTPTARAIVLADRLGESGPDDGTVHDSVSTETAHDVSVAFDASTARCLIAGHYEGAEGRASIDSADNNNTLYVTPSTTLGLTASGAHGIYHDGGNAVIAPSRVQDIGGDGIHIGPSGPGTFHISPDISYGGVSGDAINVESVLQGQNVSTVPYEQRINGTVTYLGGDNWIRLSYPDGWRLSQSGTTTVSSGSTATATAFAGNPSAYQWDSMWATVAVDPSNTPSAAIAYDHHFEWNTSNGQAELVLEETSGNGSVDLIWRVYFR